MIPTDPDEVLNNTASAHERPKGIGCPYGEVPIRRTQKDDLIRVKSFLASYSTPDSLRTTYAGRHIAVLRSKNTTRLYKGVEGYFNILSPNAVSGQHSSGQLWVEGGPQNTFNSIQAGWAISPLYFGDEKTRAFIYWQGEGNIKGCFNLQCPGFVQVDKDYAIDRVLPVSEFDKEQTKFPLGIIQDEETKDWWLLNIHFSIQIQVVDDRAGYKRSPDQDFLETFTDAPSCYDVKDYGYTHETGYTIMYGGPGGSC